MPQNCSDTGFPGNSANFRLQTLIGREFAAFGRSANGLPDESGYTLQALLSDFRTKQNHARTADY